MNDTNRRQAGELTDMEITPAMIEAGVEILREHFGGETEGDNRFVDFRRVSRALLQASLARVSRG